jgi:hypothetical protein
MPSLSTSPAVVLIQLRIPNPPGHTLRPGVAISVDDDHFRCAVCREVKEYQSTHYLQLLSDESSRQVCCDCTAGGPPLQTAEYGSLADQ